MKATGERCDRCLWQEKGAERVAAVGERRSRTGGRRTPGTATGIVRRVEACVIIG